MQISPSERLILLMLCDLHEELKVRSEIDPKFVRTAILDGQPWAIEWTYENILREPPSDKVVDETAEILSMWSVIESHYRKLSDADKDRVKSSYHGQEPKFEGFDGNNDRHFGVAHFLIKDMGRFEEFADRALNSHSQASIISYKRMLPAYGKKMQNLQELLSAEDIIEILDARKIQDND